MGFTIQGSGFRGSFKASRPRMLYSFVYASKHFNRILGDRRFRASCTYLVYTYIGVKCSLKQVYYTHYKYRVKVFTTGVHDPLKFSV